MTTTECPSLQDAAARRRERRETIDVVSKLMLAVFTVPTVIITQAVISRHNDRQDGVQIATFESHKRLAEAELARGLVPMLLKEGAERELGLRLLASVAPQQAADFVTVLQATGQAMPAKVAAEVRAVGRTRMAERALEDALAEARMRRAMGNDAEAYRAMYRSYLALPGGLRARAEKADLTRAQSAYAHGSYAQAAATLDEMLADLLVARPAESASLGPLASEPRTKNGEEHEESSPKHHVPRSDSR